MLLILATLLSVFGSIRTLNEGETGSPGDSGMREESAADKTVAEMKAGATEQINGCILTEYTVVEGGRTVTGRLYCPQGYEASEAGPVLILCPCPGAGRDQTQGRAVAYALEGLPCFAVDEPEEGNATLAGGIRDMGILIRGLLNQSMAGPGDLIPVGRGQGALTAACSAAVYEDAVGYVIMEELPIRMLDGSAGSEVLKALGLAADFLSESYVTGDDEHYTPLSLFSACREPVLILAGEGDALAELEDAALATSLLGDSMVMTLKSGGYVSGAGPDSAELSRDAAELVAAQLEAGAFIGEIDSPAGEAGDAEADTDPEATDVAETESADSPEKPDRGETEEAPAGSDVDGAGESGPQAPENEDTEVRLPSAEQFKKRLNVACVGDSLTTGYKLEHPRQQCYPTHLQELLGEGYQVVNYGKGGYALNAPSPVYTSHQYYTKSQKLAADYYVILLGTNDAIPSAWDPAGFEAALREMVRVYREANPDAVIILMTPSKIFRKVTTDTSVLNNDLLVNEIIPIIKTVAADTGSRLIDLYTLTADRRELFLSDELHPNEEGTTYMAELVAEAIRDE